jgi:hypothetical protein
MNSTAGKIPVGIVTGIFPRHNAFATMTECCLKPGWKISIDGVEGVHVIESLQINHISHDQVPKGSHVGIKAEVIPVRQLRHGARIWLHEKAEAHHSDPLNEGRTLTGKFRLDG